MSLSRRPGTPPARLRDPSEQRLTLRTILPAFAGIALLAAIATYSFMTILSSAPLASKSPAPITPQPSHISVVVTPSGPTPAVTASPTATAEPTETPSPEPTAVPEPSAAPAIASVLLAQRASNGVWSVNVRYPKLDPASVPTAAAINASIADFVTTTVEQWKVGPAAVPQEGHKTNTLTGTYSVALASARLVSLRLQLVDDSGGAAPSTTVQTLSYDLITGRHLGFADVFADSDAALAILSERSRAVLKTHLGVDYDQTVVTDGTAPTMSNFAGWALTTDGLEITFGEYQVAPLALGLPRIVVPWSELAQVLDPRGPAAALAGL